MQKKTKQAKEKQQTLSFLLLLFALSFSNNTKNEGKTMQTNTVFFAFSVAFVLFFQFVFLVFC